MNIRLKLKNSKKENVYSFQKKIKLVEINKNDSITSSMNKRERSIKSNKFKIYKSPNNINERLKLLNLKNNNKFRNNSIREISVINNNKNHYKNYSNNLLDISNKNNEYNKSINKNNNDYNLTETYYKYKIQFIVTELINKYNNFFINKILFFDFNEELIVPEKMKYKIINCNCNRNNFVKLFKKENTDLIEFEINNNNSNSLYKIYFQFLSKYKINYIKIFNDEKYNSINFIKIFVNNYNIFDNELNLKNTIININSHNLVSLKRFKSDNRSKNRKELFKLYDKIKNPNTLVENLLSKNSKSININHTNENNKKILNINKSKPKVNNSIINLFIKKEEKLKKEEFERFNNKVDIKNSFLLKNDNDKNIIKIKNKNRFNLSKNENNNYSENSLYMKLIKKKSIKNKVNTIFNNEKNNLKIFNYNKNILSNNNIKNIFSRKSFMRKNVSSDIKKDNILKNFNDIIENNKDFKMPNLPEGKNLKLLIFDNYGNKDYIGFSGIELYDEYGNLILILNENITTNSDNYNNKNNINNGMYLKGFENQLFFTNLEILPFEINIKLKENKKLSKIRIWNYNYTFKYDVGIKNIVIFFNKKIIFFGKLNKSSDEDFNLNNIFFTDNENIVNKIQKNDWFEDILDKIKPKEERKENNEILDKSNNSGLSLLNLGENIYSLSFEILENYLKEKDKKIEIKFQIKNTNNKILKLNCITKPKNSTFNKLINNYYILKFIGQKNKSNKFIFIFKTNNPIKYINYEDSNETTFTKLLLIKIMPPKSNNNSKINIIKKNINFNINESFKLINLNKTSKKKIKNDYQLYSIIKNIEGKNLKIDFHSNLGNKNQIGFDKINIYNDENKNVFDLIKNKDIRACNNNYFSFYNFEESNYPNKNILSKNWFDFIDDNEENSNVLASYELKLNSLIKISNIEFYNNTKDSSKSVKDITIYLDNLIIYQGKMNNLNDNKTNLTIINFDINKTIKNFEDICKEQKTKFVNKDIY